MKFKISNLTKVSFIILASLLLVSLYGFYTIKTKYNLLIEGSNTENRLLQNQFDEILKKYDSLSILVEENETNSVNDVVKEAIQDTIITDSSILTKQDSNDKAIENQIKSLKTAIIEDSNKIIEINNKITKNKVFLNQLETVNKDGLELRHDKLAAVNVNARGVKILSDLYTKTSRKKIQQIRVCFTLEGNEFIGYGHKDIYIQIVNPKNNIISTTNSFIELDEVKLMYSAKTQALYNQKDLDVCAYVDLEAKKTIKGKYIINIYNSFSKIGSTIFEYE